MGHSVQVAGDKHDTFEDGILLLLARMMLESLDRCDQSYSALQAFKLRWENTSYRHAPGVVDLGIDEIAQDSAALGELRQLLLEIQEMVTAFDNSIPATTIRQRWRVRGISYCDLQTNTVLETVDRLVELIQE